MPKLVGQRKVRFSREEVAKFNASWPCSPLRDRSYWFEFAANGDLIDTDVPEQDEGDAALALSYEAHIWLEDNCE
jgi:hypothetical protein